ncbi:MAG: peptidylprolyl isomerase, partial [Blastocatellia bacterium]
MKYLTMCLALALIGGASLTARAQEPELVNEIVARVNDDIITRQDYIQALKDFREELGKQMSGKSDAEVQTEYDKLKPTVLDLMIEDMLLEQKAKELGIDVEAEVNEEMTQIAKENGLPTAIDFEKALKAQGIDPETARAAIRKRLQHQYVLQKEVLQPIYQSLTDSEKQEYYAAHKEQFTVPGEVVLSEIYIPLEGSTATDIEQRAGRLVAELRAGGDWNKAVQQNSPPNRPSRAQNGKLGSFKLEDLKTDIKAAIENLKPGDVTEPIRLQEGYQILKLDERKAALVRGLDEQEVQRALGNMMTMQKAEEERKKYVAQLKTQAYIYIKTGYVAADTHSSNSES